MEHQFQSLVFVDLETTGLLNEKPRITELCLVAVHRSHLVHEGASGVPRVLAKLSLPLNPIVQVKPKAAQITGLNNMNLFHQKDFDLGVVKLLEEFLTRLDPPVCLIAHNGRMFDFPILQTELCSVKEIDSTFMEGGNLFCADSLLMFRHLGEIQEEILIDEDVCNDDDDDPDDSGVILSNSDNSIDLNSKHNRRRQLLTPIATSSPKKTKAGSGLSLRPPLDSPRTPYALRELFYRTFGTYPTNETHRAEEDVMMLLQIVSRHSHLTLPWIDANAEFFKDIRPLYTPRQRKHNTLLPYKR